MNTQTTQRHSVGAANYPGDVTTAIARDIETGRAFGPNYLGELMWPVSATFDPEANRTSVAFTLIAPESVSA